jgi:hypothetical protein
MKIKRLSYELLRKQPVWKWDETNEFLCPVLEYNPLPENEPTLFIKAVFETPEKYRFDGYLIGLHRYYGFGLFVEDQEFVMNLNLPDMIEENLNIICNTLGRQELVLFPLMYETNYYFEGKQKINGVISLERT